MNSADILYKESPFLPAVDLPRSEHILFMLRHGGHPARIISEDLLEILEIQMGEITEPLFWQMIQQAFPITADSLRLYCLGFLMVPHLIIGSQTALEHGTDVGANYICIEGSDDLGKRSNQYKKEMLSRVQRHFEPDVRDPKITSDPIFSYCRIFPFSTDAWNQAGLAASQHLFNEYARLI